MSPERSLNFDELIGDLRDLAGRVVALEIRDADQNLIVKAEGEFGHFENVEPGVWGFQLGGDPPPDRKDVQFIVASWIVVYLDEERVAEIHDISQDLIGPAFNLRIRMRDGITIGLWPAMPLVDQWTDMHEDTR